MQREILFRGKLSHVNIWVEGNLIIANNGSQYIIPPNVFEPDGHHLIIDSDEPWWIDENTVCQFTGLLDKNGTKIFEGDIVKSDYGYGSEACEVDFESFIYAKSECCVSDNIEVIGNIYDNPELN